MESADALVMTEAAIAPFLSIEALRPAGDLVSALGSFAASAFYARMIGAAAVQPVRGRQGQAIEGLRVDDGWADTLAVFLAATGLAAILVWAIELLFAHGPTSHAAFTAVLITTVWPYASDRGARAALVFFVILVVSSGLVLRGVMAGELIAGIAIGVACACIMRHWLPHRAVADANPRVPLRS